jgi:peptidoglycan/LPS O-acetylase OafA/YrhL
MSAIAYRPDIDGLRAVAVGTVVLFHAHLGLFPGGFVGVDVFFVISGYLITSIIARELDTGTFSLLSFYERRIRRIFPALLVVIAACLAVGAWRMTPRHYNGLAESALAAIGFHSNIYFAGKAGYFMPSAETLPLLHTWSLGVEEQFYVVAPLLLMGLWRYRASVAPVIAVLVAVTLAVSIWGTSVDSDTAFYMPHTRAIELMIGMALGIGLVPAVRSQPVRQILSAVGLLMIAVSASVYSNDTPFPGAAALLPCLGSALIIHCAGGAHGTSLIGRLLATAPTVWLGKISYSLYLWHWPLFAFAAYEWGELPVAGRLSLIAASVALAAATYRWVEQPARTSRIVLTTRRVFAVGLGSAGAVAAVAGIVTATKGLPIRLAPEIAAIERSAAVGGHRRSLCGANMRGKLNKPCALGRTDLTPSVLVWGDSHAWMLAPTLDAIGKELGIAISLVTRSGCPGLLDVGRHGLGKKKCATAFQSQIDDVLKPGTIKHVVLISRWQKLAAAPALSEQIIVKTASLSDEETLQRAKALEASFVRTVAHFREMTLRVTVVGPVPDLPVHLPTAMTKAYMRGHQLTLNYDFQDFNARHKTVLRIMRRAEYEPRVDVINPAQILCPAGTCRFWENDLPFYRDDDHLSDRGSDELKPSLIRSLSWLRQATDREAASRR